MIKEAEDNTTVDALRLQLENRIWDEKDKDEANKTAARSFLMGQVDAGRKAQIEDKGVREAEEQLEGHREVCQIGRSVGSGRSKSCRGRVARRTDRRAAASPPR